MVLKHLAKSLADLLMLTKINVHYTYLLIKICSFAI